MIRKLTYRVQLNDTHNLILLTPLCSHPSLPHTTIYGHKYRQNMKIDYPFDYFYSYHTRSPQEKHNYKKACKGDKKERGTCQLHDHCILPNTRG